MSKIYQLYCEVCNWKRITDGNDNDLYEYKTSNVPAGIPKFDPVTKKIIESKPIKAKRKFRCPQCGRVVMAKIAPNPQEKVEQMAAEVERQKLAHEWAEKDAQYRAEYEAAKRLYDEEDRVD